MAEYELQENGGKETMTETKAALKEIARQLQALTVTVAALERVVISAEKISGRDYNVIKSLGEQANQENISRVRSLIDAIPDTPQSETT